MAELKTKPTHQSVDAFLDAVPDPQRREDAKRVRAMMERVSGAPSEMWGPSIVGFGQYHYKYDSGREGDFFRIGFSPRKQDITIYIMPGYTNYDHILAKLGKYEIGTTKRGIGPCYTDKAARLAGLKEQLEPEALKQANQYEGLSATFLARFMRGFNCPTDLVARSVGDTLADWQYSDLGELPDTEARDVGVLLDWVAAQPGVQLDGEGDPRPQQERPAGPERGDMSVGNPPGDRVEDHVPGLGQEDDDARERGVPLSKKRQRSMLESKLVSYSFFTMAPFSKFQRMDSSSIPTVLRRRSLR